MISFPPQSFSLSVPSDQSSSEIEHCYPLQQRLQHGSDIEAASPSKRRALLFLSLSYSPLLQSTTARVGGNRGKLSVLHSFLTIANTSTVTTTNNKGFNLATEFGELPVRCLPPLQSLQPSPKLPAPETAAKESRLLLFVCLSSPARQLCRWTRRDRFTLCQCELYLSVVFSPPRPPQPNQPYQQQQQQMSPCIWCVTTNAV